MYYTFTVMSSSNRSVTIIAERKDTGAVIEVCVPKEHAGGYMQLIINGANGEQIAAHYQLMSLNG